MAGPYYCDPAAGSNTAPYDTWAKGATSIQTVLDLAQAGEIIYARGTQTTAATIDVDTQTGSNTAGYVRVIGCNAAGNVDGTRFVLNANGGSYSVVTAAATSDMYWLENIEVKNTAAGAYHGFTGAASGVAGWVFINCCANTCGSQGFNLGNFTVALLWRCVAYSNGGTGIISASRLFFCVGRDNTLDGLNSGSVYYGCVSHGNTDDGFGGLSFGNIFLINCVVDGNGDDGIELVAHTDLTPIGIFGCRITNQSGAGDIGLNAAGECVITAYCYFEDNDGNNIQNDTLHYNISLEGGTTTSNIEDQANTNEGYVDKTNHDFSTNYVDSGDPDLRRTAITLPWS